MASLFFPRSPLGVADQSPQRFRPLAPTRTLGSLLWTHESEKRALALSSGGHFQIPGGTIQSRRGK